MSKSGYRVLVIDADLRAPTLHHPFGALRDSGLADLFNSDVDLDGLIQCDPVSGVFLLPAGRSSCRPIDVLSSARLRAAIKNWRHSFDLILIDGPPVLSVPDTRLLVPYIDYCVFVARWGKTGWESVNQALLLMIEAGARIAGITVSRVNVKEMERYGFIDPMLYGYPYTRSTHSGIAETQP
jgi:capsular exopolysaccharide synthesis family protein